MTRKYGITGLVKAAIVLCLVLAGCGEAASTRPGWKTDNNEGLSVSYPEAWQIKHSAHYIWLSSQHIDLPEEISSGAAQVFISWSTAELDGMAGYSAVERLDGLFGRFLAHGGRFGYGLETPEDFTLRNKPARRAAAHQREIRYELHTDPAKDGLYFAFILDADIAGTALCYSLQGEFAPFESDCIAIVESIHYQPPA